MIRRRPRQRERGQAITELALTLPLLLLVLVAIGDLGRMLFVSVELQQAAQEGALYGGQNPSPEAAIISRVRSSSNAAEVTGATVTVTCSTSPAPGTVRVEAEFDLTLWTPIVGDLLGSPFHLGGISTSTNFKGAC